MSRFLSRLLNVKYESQDRGDDDITHSEFRKLMLSSYMAVITFSLAVIYAIYDFSAGVFFAAPTYAILIVSSTVTLALLRSNHYNYARIVLLVGTNLAICWSVLLDPPETGAIMFLIPTALAAFFLFEFEHVRISIALAALTLLLFFVLYAGNFTAFRQETTAEYAQTSFVINFVCVFVVSVLGVYFLLLLNNRSESELLKSKNSVEAKNKELEKINLEMDRFVYSVSHDLRSPLTSILGLIQIANLTTDPDELRGILNMVKSRVKVQEQFIEEINDYSRNNRVELVMEQIHLRALIDNIIQSLRFSENFAHVSIRNLIDDVIVIDSDKIRLSLVIRNLIANAIKYADHTKEACFVEVTMDTASSIIHVKDNGTGISPEHLGNVFRMFYRASEKSMGSGLGLFISSEAIARLGGRITVTSEEGVGSTFSVHLK